LSAEKGYLHWQEDIRTDDTPLEANISFICKLKTNIKFLGKEVLMKQNKQGMKKRLVYCRIKNPYIRVNGLETVWKGKECVGYSFYSR
jgi:glycine cleavage system aminomethyltransferase T